MSLAAAALFTVSALLARHNIPKSAVKYKTEGDDDDDDDDDNIINQASVSSMSIWQNFCRPKIIQCRKEAKSNQWCAFTVPHLGLVCVCIALHRHLVHSLIH